jgi:hypothetical protein
MVTGQAPTEDQFEGLTWGLDRQGKAIAASQHMIAWLRLQGISPIVAHRHSRWDVSLTSTFGRTAARPRQHRHSRDRRGAGVGAVFIAMRRLRRCRMRSANRRSTCHFTGTPLGCRSASSSLAASATRRLCSASRQSLKSGPGTAVGRTIGFNPTGQLRPAVYGHQWRRPILIRLRTCLRVRDNAAKAVLGSIHAI